MRIQASFLRITWALWLEGVLIANRLLRLLSTGLEEGEVGGVSGGVVVLVLVKEVVVVLVDLGLWSVISTAR